MAKWRAESERATPSGQRSSRPTRASPDAINPHYLFAELDKVIEPTDIVFNEAMRNAGALTLQVAAAASPAP